METNYLTRKISSAEVLEAVQKFTGAELWNCTYGQAMELLMQNGHFPVVAPMFTYALTTNTGWSVEIVSVPNGDGTKMTNHASDVFYKSWEEAMDYAIKYAAKKCSAKKEYIAPETQVKEPVIGMGHKMYSRHSEEDPFPFE